MLDGEVKHASKTLVWRGFQPNIPISLFLVFAPVCILLLDLVFLTVSQGTIVDLAGKTAPKVIHVAKFKSLF
jgi:hypothetical protein